MRSAEQTAVRFLALSVSVLTLAIGSRAIAQPLPDFDSCIQRLDPGTDIGYARIGARCADLMRQIDSSSWASWMPRGWKSADNDLSVGSLTELRELAGRELALTARKGPDVGSLRPILATLEKSNAPDRGVWGRFKTWLRSVFEYRERAPGEGWFSRMVARAGYTQSVIELVTYVALTVVVGLAAFILYNELRTAGVIRRRRAAASKRRATSQAFLAVPLGWTEAELREQPRVLLELIANRLRHSGALPPSAGLTVRELARAARVAAPDRTRIADLGLIAERVRFSGADIEPSCLQKPLDSGRELLQRLSAEAAA